MNSYLKKTLVAIVTSLALLGSLASCGSSSKTDSTSTAAAATAQNDGAALKIAIVTSPSGVDDGSFNQDNYNGILNFIKNNPNSTVKAVREPTGDPKAAVQAVADIVADYDVIVCPGFQFSGISKLALDNPDKKFILIDTNPDKQGKQEVFDNIYAMTFAEQESGFYAGMAASLESKTGKVAVVNGIAYPSNVNYQFGFMSGVNYADKKYGKNVKYIELPSYAGTDVTNKKVGGNYAGSFSDESTGKVIGNTLLQQGCDIIFVAAGATGNGVFTAVKEAKNAKVIGCDVDQYKDGKNGDQNIVLTSALKVMSMNVEKALNAVKDGSFKGANVLLKADTDSTGYVKADGHHQLSSDTIAKIDEAYALVKSGTIVPASNFNGFTPVNFPGLPGYKK